MRFATALTLLGILLAPHLACADCPDGAPPWWQRYARILWSAGMETGDLSEWSEKVNSDAADSWAVRAESEGIPPRGGDWVLKRPDGVLELDLRITLETDDGALIHMTFEGIRDDGAKGAPYFRTLPRFETADTKYSFLNRLLAVGAGEIGAGGPVHVIEEIL